MLNPLPARRAADSQEITTKILFSNDSGLIKIVRLLIKSAKNGKGGKIIYLSYIGGNNRVTSRSIPITIQ